MNPHTLIRKLVCTYEPLLRFSVEENYYPLNVVDYVRRCSLYDEDGATPVVPEGKVTLRGLSRRYANDPSYYLKFVESHRPAPKVAYSPQQERLWRLWLEVGGRGKQASRAQWEQFVQEADLAPYVSPEAKLQLPSWLRLDLPPEIVQGAEESYQEIQEEKPNRYAYYYRYKADRTSGYRVLQYWFFYAFNDWASSFGGMNDHEADWECVTLFFKRSSERLEPQYVTYSWHVWRETRPWCEVELDGESHPVVYVGRGSHASYFEPGRYIFEMDYAQGDDLAIGPGHGCPWRGRIGLHGQRWVNRYAGLWGARYGRGRTAPGGPRFNRDGTVRAKWRDPVGWAGLR
jgi:hypothetical protein